MSKSKLVSDLEMRFEQYEAECARVSAHEDDWSDIAPPSQAALETAVENALKSTPRNKTVLKIASHFYMLSDEPPKAADAMKQWADAEKKSIVPIVMHAQYFSDDLLNYDEFLADMEEGLKRKPRSPMLLAMAYDGAFEQGDDARRLHWAIELAKVSDSPNHYFRCGGELGRNLMLEKAQSVFKKALKKNSSHTWCWNGLGQCHLQQLDLDAAEDCFEKSMAIEETELAQKNLTYIDSLLQGEAKSELEKKQKQLWQDESEGELKRISKEEQKRLMAEVFVRA